MKNDLTMFHWAVGNLPFIWGHLSAPTNGDGIPDAMPFALYIDDKIGLLRQVPNSLVSSALSVVYSKGSMITGMMDNVGIGKQYADDFLHFLQKSLKKSIFDASRVLEIGCGTGYLLSRLQYLGAECIGIEPGKHGQNGAEKYGVKIINDFFPSEEIKGKFDIIIFYGVLEHIEDPLDFLIQVKSYLNIDGTIVLGVPDCEPYIEKGDISFLLHEHWSYFVRQTLLNTLISAGASEPNVFKSEFGGLLYAAAKFKKNHFETKLQAVASEVEKALMFRQGSEEMIRELSCFIRQAQDEGKTIGIYVPGRAANALTLAKTSLSHCRFFDDNSLLQGTYYPGIDIPIESRQNLIDNPSDIVIIMSYSFGYKIAEELKQILPSTTIIKTWSNMFC